MELFKLLGTVAIDTSEANQAIDDVTDKAQDSEKKQTGAFSKIGTAAGTLAKGVMGAGAALGGAFIAATEGTREYRTSMGQLEAAFMTADHSAAAAKNTYTDLNAVLGDSGQATEAAQQLAMLTDNEKELDNWTHILTGVYATFGEALPVEGLAEAANHTAKVGEVQGSLADALEWSGVSVDSFNKQLAACSTEQERQQLITKTMNELYGESADNYKEVNKDVMEAEKAQGRLTDAFARVGGVLEPVMTSLKNGFAGAIEFILPFVEKMTDEIPSGVENMRAKFNEFMPYLKAAWSGLWSVIQTAWQNVGKPVFEFIKHAANQLIAFWKQNWPAVAAVIRDVFGIIKNLWNSVLKPVLTILGNYIKNNLLPVWKTAFNAALKVVQTVFSGIIKLWNGSLKPILNGLISFVSGVLSGNWKKAWNGIKSVTSGVFSGIKTVISTAINTVKSVFSGGLSILKKSASTSFESIRKSVSEKMDAVRKKVKEIIEKVKGFFPLKVGKILDNIKIPKISVSGGKAPYGIAGKGKLPSFSVKWNAEGGILTKPTIFGMSGNTFLGGGEAGEEAILPIDTLKAYINESVNSRNIELLAGLEIQVSRLISFMQAYFPANYEIMLDTGILAGQLAPEMDNRLAEIYRYNKRGNTR